MQKQEFHRIISSFASIFQVLLLKAQRQGKTQFLSHFMQSQGLIPCSKVCNCSLNTAVLNPLNIIYLNMQEKVDKKEYQLVQATQNSPSEVTIIDEQLQINSEPKKVFVRSTYIKYSGILIILIILGVLATGSLTRKNPPKIKTVPYSTGNVFKFQVYCPINYYPYLYHDSENNDDLRRLLDDPYNFGPYRFVPESIDEEKDNFNSAQTYVVSMISAYDQNGEARLRYCGLTREWNGDCTNPSYTCSSPGPMFDFKVNQEVDVIWINQLSADIVPSEDSQLLNTCIQDHPDKDQWCTLGFKADLTQTYKDPTNLPHQSSNQARISPKNWPTSTHIHGLEVRPTFDGNPLSWISNNGTRGEGELSLDQSCYYNNFDNEDDRKNNYLPPNIKFINPDFNNVMKINRYPNSQNPGNLWYHDHSMRLTMYNAYQGLAGSYIIRSPRVEKLLPTGERQRYIMRTMEGWESLNLTHQPNAIYRYRILNNNPLNVTKISFTYGNCADKNFEPIPFTIIGSDSSLLNETIPDVKEVQLGQAERIEILIKFDDTHPIFQICSPFVENPYPDPDPDNKPKQTKTPKSKSKNTEIVGTYKVNNKNIISYTPKDTQITDIEEVQYLGVPYTDLSKSTDKISRYRMRPLMKTNTERFMINGHQDFHKGAAEDPVIGSTEDWYIINTVYEGHPIHFHLINFQIVEQVKLRYINNTQSEKIKFKPYCSFYEMDFLLAAMKLTEGKQVKKLIKLLSPKGVFDYQQFCNLYSSKNYTLSDGNVYIWDDIYLRGISEAMYQINQENVYDQDTLISGINVNELIRKDPSYVKILNISSCSYNTTHKYVCRQTDNGKTWYRRWKDTALVDPLTVFRYRIRWTMSDYKKGGSYFHVPVDQLRQFPGYVYHCHILDHEDDQMMRSIMLQIPSDYISTNKASKCRQRKWENKYECLNEQCLAANAQKQQSNKKKRNNRLLQNQ